MAYGALLSVGIPTDRVENATLCSLSVEFAACSCALGDDVALEEPVESVLDVSVLLRVGVAVVSALACVFGLGGDSLWRVGFLLFFSGLAAVPAFAFRASTTRFSQRHPVLALTLVMSMQSAMIAVTGGARSPVMFAFIPTTYIAGTALSSRQLARVMPFPLIVSSGFVAATLLGYLDWPCPDVFLFDVPMVWGISIWIFYTGALIAGSRLGWRAASQLRWQAKETAKAQQMVIDGLYSRQRDMEAFTAGVAHELKGPLTAVQALATTLYRRDDLDARNRKGLGILVDQVHRLRDAVQDLLDVYRPMESLRVGLVDLESLVSDVVDTMEGVALDCRVDVVFRLSESVEVLADPRKIRAVLFCLLENAIEASPAGTCVTVVVRALDASAVVSVSDQGAGVAPEIRERLFVAGASTKKTGNGLGLFTSRFLAEQHGGTVVLINRDGRGCEACLSLPLMGEMT